MPYTIDPSSADCYPCTSVLINKFDLRSQQELDRVEAVLVTAKAAQWEESPLCSTFDFEHYKAIHRHLFCDLYEWAGVPRSINISKKGTQFCPADEIPRVSSAIFRRLAEQNFFQSLSFDDFVDAFVDFYIRTNELHPFREGNGRTQRVFLAATRTARRVSVGFFLHRPRRADGRHHLVGAGRGYYAAPAFP